MNRLLVALLVLLVSCGDGRLSPQGGTITNGVAGTGLTGGGTGGTITFNVGCGTGLVCNANDITVSSGVNMFSTLNAIPKGNGTGLVASGITDNGTTIAMDAAGSISLGIASIVKVDVTGATTSITNNLTSGDAAGDVFDHNGQLVKFGSAGDGHTYFDNNILAFGHAQNVEFTGYVNYVGYLQGTTQFRNLIIGDGKTGDIATFTGSDKSLAVVGNLSTQANLTAGDNVADSHTIAGGVNINAASTGRGLDRALGIAGTSWFSLFHYAAAEDIYLRGGKTPSIIYVGDVNTGGVFIGAAGNATQVTGTATVLGNTQLGDASTDRVGIGTAPDTNHAMTFAAAVGNKIALYPNSATAAFGFGIQAGKLQYYVDASTGVHSFGYGDSDAFTESFRIDADGQVWAGDTANSAVSNNLDVLTIGNTGTGHTTSNLALLRIDGSSQGYDLTTSKQSYGLVVDMGDATGACTFCTGASTLREAALYVKAGEADFMYSAVFGHGVPYFTDGIRIGGDSVGNSLADNATDDGDESIVIQASPAGLAFDYYAVFVDTGATLDATAAARAHYAYYANADATRSAGTNDVTNYGLYATASAGQQNYAAYFAGASAKVHFENGPAGINNYYGTHFEWTEEFMSRAQGTSCNALYITDLYQCSGSGTGNNIDDIADSPLGDSATASGRLGAWALDTGTTTTGFVRLLTGTDSIGFATGNHTYEATVRYLNLSTSGEEYSSNVGFYDTSTVDPVDGCYFLYDRGATQATPGTGDSDVTGDRWKIMCSSNSVRTGWDLDGTATQDGFTSVNSPVAAATWYRLKIVMEGTSKARFYINGTEVGRITTNIPSGTSRLTQTGFHILKSAGTTSRYLYVDQTRLAVDLTTAR